MLSSREIRFSALACLLGFFGAPFTGRAGERPYAVVPGLKISPEVGVGIGVVAFHSALPKPGSRFDLKVLATTRLQADLRLRHRDSRFLGSDWELRGQAEAFRFPDSYFGGGNSPADSDETYYTPVGGGLALEFARPLPGRWRLLGGGRTDFLSIGDIRKADGSAGAENILGPDVPGRGGGTVLFSWGGLEYDTRDNPDVPQNGIHAGQRLGISPAGGFRFGAAETWISSYRPLGKHWEAAGRLWQKTVWGPAPFFEHPYLGDENILRGVVHKRFRDRSAQAAQTELRFGFPLALPILDDWLGRHWQAAAFAEAGRVGGDFLEASRAAVHFSGGAGGRLLLGARQGAIRGDAAFSAHGMALIIDFNQAF